MRLIGKLAIVAMVALLVVAVAAQDRQDFSGRWVLERSQPTGTAALGVDFMVVQSDQTLQVNLMTVGQRDVPAADGGAPEYPAKITFTLDGVEHPTRVLFEQPLPQVRPGPSVVTAATEESTSKAVWVGRALVLMSYNKRRTTVADREPNSVTTRQTVRRVLTIDSAGRLEVESMILADPEPWARSVSTPSQVKSTYRRQQ